MNKKTSENDLNNVFLERCLRMNILPQSYLFYGDNYPDMLQDALMFTKRLLCKEKVKQNCQCQSCQAFSRQKNNTISHPDLIGLDFEWSDISRTGEGVKQIRTVLHQLSLSPLWGQRKVAILRYADSFNKESANTLLKTLEEPSKSSYIILLAKSMNNVLPTITSRTINIEFRKQADESENRELIRDHQPWIDALSLPLYKKFNLVDEIVKKEEYHEFLNVLEKFIIYACRDRYKSRSSIKKENLKLHASFLKELTKTRRIITKTNANKKLALEVLLLNSEDLC